MQLYPPHIRLDFRNLNPNISLLPRLHDARDIGLAMLALLRPHRKLARRIGMQRPVRAEMRLALGLARRLARRLVALAGWGYLNCRASSTAASASREASYSLDERRLLLFQPRDAFLHRIKPRQQRGDQRAFFGARQQ
jgi:hypothetical protein